MSLLDTPQAQALLDDAVVKPETVAGCAERLSDFLQRYLPLFYRIEQRELAALSIQGKLSQLERKTCEPIAYLANQPRKPMQHFVGAGLWDDEAVMAELRQHVGEELGDVEGILIVDGSAFPKKGSESCGVARQWCGRLGKLENCQVGVFLAYSSSKGYAPLDRRLYLPQEWADDPWRRRKCHVPAEVEFQEKWRIAIDLLARSAQVPHGWVAGDDEFGRVSGFRSWLRRQRQRYVLDVPANTLVRELKLEPDGRKPPFERADQWAARQPEARWRRVKVRDGEKGPVYVTALMAKVQVKDEDGRVGGSERLVVIRSVEGEVRTWYVLSNTSAHLKVLVRVHSGRHQIEEVFQQGKGEVGLGHYEVRSWVGWHHHMTLSLLALWFLCQEKRRLGKKNTGCDRAADTADLLSFAWPHSSDSSPTRRRDYARAPT
jgi:SRSO17 transposase